jgi:hypothetical protein
MTRLHFAGDGLAAVVYISLPGCVRDGISAGYGGMPENRQTESIACGE